MKNSPSRLVKLARPYACGVNFRHYGELFVLLTLTVEGQGDCYLVSSSWSVTVLFMQRDRDTHHQTEQE